jgi:uncharacterized SAM-binding protein YcdF (DUF218 family)
LAIKLKRNFGKLLLLSFLSVSIFIASSISINLINAFRQSPNPQAILTLGGGVEREEFTAKFAHSYPSLPIWISSGLPQKQARQIFQEAGINQKQVNLDYRAADTVSNFTSLVKDFNRKNYQHIYLITSDFHLSRAKAIAFIVLGSYGIAYTPIAIPSDKASESKIKVIRDTIRAVVWLITGKTGSSLNTKYAQT